MLLLDLLSIYQDIISSFAIYPLYEATQIFGICAGMMIAGKILRKVSDGF